MELILIRHGQTEANRRGAFQGWLDLSLSAQGQKQVKCLKNELADYKIDKIYVSPLKRAVETAQIIREGLKNPPELLKMEDLKEMNFGDWDGLCSDEIETNYPEEYLRWQKDWQRVVIPGGESAEKMYERVTNWVDECLTQAKPNEKILLISHQGVILQIISYLLGMNLADCWHFRVDPGSMSVIQIKSDFPILTLLNYKL
ncbi:MAG: alpha-ribazole phosphatase [Halanaerobiales bacterium]|nr:alpha-ribazole phosphatase [Halanaerobiales bacterium]